MFAIPEISKLLSIFFLTKNQDLSIMKLTSQSPNSAPLSKFPPSLPWQGSHLFYITKEDFINFQIFALYKWPP